MSVMERVKKLREEAKSLLNSDELTEEIVAQAQEKANLAKSLYDSASILDETNDVEKAQRPPLPITPTEPVNTKSVDEGEDELAKSVNFLRFGDIDEHETRIQKELYGKSYNQLNSEMDRELRRYLVSGENKFGSRQAWDWGTAKSMLEAGNTIAEIKSTMVEAEDVLGGVALPPERANQVITRMAGLTAVRGGGATTVRTTGKSIDWLEITGADAKHRYPSALRGSWGNETKNRPDETNITFGLMNIPAHIYTYRVPFSVSLLEDATDVVGWFLRNVSETLSIDEDDAFVVGDGVKRPWGILPGGLNTRGLNSVNSGGATTLTMDGLKKLRRGIASQYRAMNGASLIGNSATGGALELLKDANDNYYFKDGIEVGERLPHIKANWRETEALPDIGAGTVPLIYGNLSGYVIVERMGLSIQRYNDSYTGINLVDYQVRRRVGGDVIEPWKFAVQTVGA